VAEYLAVEDPEERQPRDAELEFTKGTLENRKVVAGKRMLVERPETRNAEAADQMPAR
jgi:hypothetical protein